MRSYEKRLATFISWPHASPQPTDLAKAGFEFVPSRHCRDKVRCTECLQYLGDWKPEDNPLLEHTRWQPDCKLAKKLTDANKQRTPSAPQSFAKEVVQPVAQPAPKFKSKPAIKARVVVEKAFQEKVQKVLSKHHEQQSDMKLRQRKTSKQDHQKENQSLTVKVTQPVTQPTPGLKVQPAIEAQSDAQKASEKKIQQVWSKLLEQEQSNLLLRQRKTGMQDQQQKPKLPQMTAQDAEQKQSDESVLPTAQITSVSVVISSASPKLSPAPINPITTPEIPAAAAAAVSEISKSSGPATPPPASYSPADQPSSEPSCDTKAEKALAKISESVSEDSLGKTVLDVGDWVELELDEEEKDDWVQV